MDSSLVKSWPLGARMGTQYGVKMFHGNIEGKNLLKNNLLKNSRTKVTQVSVVGLGPHVLNPKALDHYTF